MALLTGAFLHIQYLFFLFKIFNDFASLYSYIMFAQSESMLKLLERASLFPSFSLDYLFLLDIIKNYEYYEYFHKNRGLRSAITYYTNICQ